MKKTFTLRSKGTEFSVSTVSGRRYLVIDFVRRTVELRSEDFKRAMRYRNANTARRVVLDTVTGTTTDLEWVGGSGQSYDSFPVKLVRKNA